MDKLKVLEFPAIRGSLQPWIDLIVTHKWGIGATAFVGVVAWKVLAPKKSKLPPGPKGWPLIGCTSILEGNTVEKLRILTEKYGDVIYVPLPLGTGMVMLTTHRAIKDAFVTQGVAFNNRPVAGMALFNYMDLADEVFCPSYSEKWKVDKKFAAGALRQFGSKKGGAEDKILFEMSILVEYITKQNGQAIDIDSCLRKVTANVIHSMLFGERFDHDDPRLTNLIEMVVSWFSDTMQLSEPAEMLPRMLLNLFYRRQLNKLIKEADSLKKYVTQKIDEHRDTFNSDNIRDFVDVYLNERLEKEDCDWKKTTTTVLMFMPDALDTLRLLISFVVLYLTKYPDSQREIQEQIDAAIGSEKDVLLEHKPALPALESFIMETIRLVCPVPQTAPHCCTENSTLNGYDIPKGIMINGMLENAMHNEKDFPEPSVFKPHRFLNDDGKLCKTDMWIPFGMGRRLCMGEQVSKMELFLVTANLLKNFSFKFDDTNQSMEPVAHVLKQPPPYKVIFTPR